MSAKLSHLHRLYIVFLQAVSCTALVTSFCVCARQPSRPTALLAAVTQRAGEDYHELLSYVGVICDGVSGGPNNEDYRHQSALKSISLGAACKRQALRLANFSPDTLPNPDEYNHAKHILLEGEKHACRYNSYNDHGSTTCLVAAPNKGKLDVASVGDCQLAVLRMDPESGRLRVVHLTPATYCQYDLVHTEPRARALQ